MPVSLSTDRPIRLLVSVRDADEAQLAEGAGADLIDAKDPEQGALGALPVETVRAIRRRLNGTAATSAVAGEPEDDADLVARVTSMARSGVDFVKVAIGSSVADEALRRAADAARGRLIGVFFAEDTPSPSDAVRVAALGFGGAMIDTRGKDGRSLTDHLSTERLQAFAAACHTHGLLCGLAGSLRIEDVPTLSALGPGYLGFRGGLCRDGDRRGALDADRVAAVVAALRLAERRNAA